MVETTEHAHGGAEDERLRPGLGAAVSALRGNRAFQCLWFSNLFFFGGVWMQTLVLGWLAYEMTHSEFLVGVYTAVRLAPMLVGPLSGALADRFNKVRLLIVACGWSTLGIAVVAALASAGALSYPALVIGGLVIGLAQSPSQPARGALAMELVGPSHVSNANALNALALNMTQVIGPAMGGALIATLGAPTALWISVSWYVLSLLLMLPLRGRGKPASGHHGSPFAMAASGFRVIGASPVAVAALLVTVGANVLIWPVYQSFMPVFADRMLHLDAAGLGVLLSCAGTGGLVGSLLIAGLGDFRFKGALFVYGTAVWAALWTVFSLSGTVWLSYGLLVLAGVASAAFGVLQSTLVLLATPPAVHGRAMGLLELAIGVMPLSTLALGAIAELTGVAAMSAVAGVLMLLTLGGVVLRFPGLRTFRGVQGTPD
ncbi:MULTISPECIES: MFS transporter [Arthrobacter]|uniref:MFS transporter n=2 Tax=Arthrobacter TaxID=1663 RepID=A0ABU9KIN9_9MICC|nr:MFS transporter [Arthrobacter sp. YJM1]MDP5226247.1 MFS transporter [Arthrobacter sp. YJM1]